VGSEKWEVGNIRNRRWEMRGGKLEMRN